MARAGIAMLGVAACGFRHGAVPASDALLRSDAPPTDAPPPTDALLDGPRPGPVAWYEMETLSTGVAPDSSGSGHAGTCTSCPTVAPGRIGNAYLFSTGTRIDVVSDAGLATMTGFTVALWMRVDASLSSYACPVNRGLGSASDNSWQLCLAQNRTFFYYTGDGVTGDALTSSMVFPLNTWHHVAITWDGSTKQVWYDGASIASGGATSIAYDGRTITLGADVDDTVSGTNVAALPGALDDVRIYDHALSAAEIAALAM